MGRSETEFRLPETVCARVKRVRFGANVGFAQRLAAKRLSSPSYTNLR